MKSKTVCAAIAAASAVIPMAANAAWDNTVIFTNTVDGITWRYFVDDQNKAISLYSYKSSDTGQMIDPQTTGIIYIPSTFTHTNGVVYNITRLNHRGLAACTKLTGVVLPETTFAQTTGEYGYNSSYNGKELFKESTSLVAIWWKGPETVASGTQPVSKSGRTTYTFGGCTKLRAVVFGPNVTYSANGGANYPLFNGCSGVRAFFPKARWKNFPGTSYTNKVTQCKPILYGPGEDIDVSIDGTFTVATAERLDDVLSVANDLYTYCRMSPRISVTNAIEFTEGLITTERMRFATFNSLMFKVRTQAELANILAAVPASVPLSIDPTEATENLEITTTGRNIHVRLPDNGKYKVKPDGIIIIVK